MGPSHSTLNQTGLLSLLRKVHWPSTGFSCKQAAYFKITSPAYKRSFSGMGPNRAVGVANGEVGGGVVTDLMFSIYYLKEMTILSLNVLQPSHSPKHFCNADASLN